MLSVPAGHGPQAPSFDWDEPVFLPLTHILRRLYHLANKNLPLNPTEMFLPFCSEGTLEITCIRDFFFQFSWCVILQRKQCVP